MSKPRKTLRKRGPTGGIMYTKAGRMYTTEVREALAPILKKYNERGYHPIETSLLMFRQFEALAIEYMTYEQIHTYARMRK